MVAEDIDEEEPSHEDVNQNLHNEIENFVTVIEDFDRVLAQEDLNQGSFTGSLSWLKDLQDGGQIKMIDVNNDLVGGWSSPPGDFFQVRGEDYLMTKRKIPGGENVLKPIAFDWIKSGKGRIDEVLRHPQNRISKAIENGGMVEGHFFWAFNIQVPCNEHYSLIAYYMSTTPFSEGSLIDRFIKGDDNFKNSRLKLIASIVKGPWVVKSAVGDHAICLLGKSLTCKYVQGKNFLEVDVDIGSSVVANTIVHLALNYVTSLTVDLAFLVEGRTKDELPERILGTIRFSKLDLAAATPIEAIANSNIILSDLSTTEVSPISFEKKEDKKDPKSTSTIDETGGDQSFQSRFWKSLGQGLSMEWWGRQEW